jgi:hypothetical protein
MKLGRKTGKGLATKERKENKEIGGKTGKFLTGKHEDMKTRNGRIGAK